MAIAVPQLMPARVARSLRKLVPSLFSLLASVAVSIVAVSIIISVIGLLLCSRRLAGGSLDNINSPQTAL
jgi:cellobiose-specific phosphotransferase system component IIC